MHTLSNDIQVRTATVDDADAIAKLHAESWRLTYQSILDAQYLQDRVEADRLEYWRERLGADRTDEFVLVAVEGGSIVGFGYWIAKADEEWGSQVESMHVSPGILGKGVGSLLLDEGKRRCAEVDPGSGASSGCWTGTSRPGGLPAPGEPCPRGRRSGSARRARGCAWFVWLGPRRYRPRPPRLGYGRRRRWTDTDADPDGTGSASVVPRDAAAGSHRSGRGVLGQ